MRTKSRQLSQGWHLQNRCLALPTQRWQNQLLLDMEAHSDMFREGCSSFWVNKQRADVSIHLCDRQIHNISHIHKVRKWDKSSVLVHIKEYSILLVPESYFNGQRWDFQKILGDLGPKSHCNSLGLISYSQKYNLENPISVSLSVEIPDPVEVLKSVSWLEKRKLGALTEWPCWLLRRATNLLQI